MKAAGDGPVQGRRRSWERKTLLVIFDSISGLNTEWSAMKESSRMSDGTVRALRLACIGAGAALCLLGLFGRFAGLASGMAFTLNEALTIFAGAVLVCAGLLGRRFPNAYRRAAVLLLNTILALLVLELLSLGIMKVLVLTGAGSPEGTGTARDVGAPVRADTPPLWYEPYLVWRGIPDLPEPESSDSLGFRITPGSSADPEDIGIHVFGSSLVWGLGVPDSATVTAHMVRILEDRFERPFRIMNHGVVGWVSTQQLLQLIFLLRDGLRPDIVIFINGFNDVLSAYQSGSAGNHYKLEPIASRVEGRTDTAPSPSVLEQTAWSTNTAHLLQTLGYRRPARTEGFEDERDATPSRSEGLSEEVAEVYRRNMRFVSVLGNAHGYRSFFFLQPSVWTGGKPLTEHEQVVRTGGFPGYPDGSDPAYIEYFRRSYARIDSIMGTEDGFSSLAGVFDTVVQTVYFEPSGCHVTAEANRMIAEYVCDRISPAVSAVMEPDGR